MEQFGRSDYIVIDNGSDPLDEIKMHLRDEDCRITLASPIPPLCRTNECIVGIDEAGRGPVLGPMVYGLSFCLKKDEHILGELGCADSKTLNESKRENIFMQLCQQSDSLGWIVDIIAPNQISNCMLRRQKYNLNEVSHNSAIELIKLLRSRDVVVSDIFIDTVGPPEKYQTKLTTLFPEINVRVEKKADSRFAIVSAASICAKVIRDLAVSSWNFSETVKIIRESGWGSGYPGDQPTKTFLKENMDPVFGFPRIVRFSWSTCEDLLQKNDAVSVNWEEENPEEASTTIRTYFNSSVASSNSSHIFFKERKLKSADTF